MNAGTPIPGHVIADLITKAKVKAAKAWYHAHHKGLVQVHGSPSRKIPTKDGKYVLAGLNESYWAGVWALQNFALYDQSEGTFYRYDSTSGLWGPITENAIKQEISRTILEISRTMAHSRDLDEYRRDSDLSAVVRQLRGMLEKPSPFENRPKVVHLANCCLGIESGTRELRGYSPDIYSRNQSPIPYCPSATCPKFLDDLIKPAVHPDDVDLIQRYMGLCLLGDNVTSRILILDGEGGLGKSQLAKIIRGITGRQNTFELRTKHVAGRFETFRFRGKTLLMGIDVLPDFLSTEGASELKKLTGGDPTNPERKCGNEVFELMGSFCVVITSNTRLKLTLRGDNSAWRRRLLIVRFVGAKPRRKIPSYAEHLLATEGPGILNWALEGLEKLLAEIAIDNDFVLTGRQKQIVDDLIDESDSLRIFVKQRLRLASGSSVTTSEVILAYVEFCRSKGWEQGLRTSEIISRQLVDLMLEVHQRDRSNDLGPNGTNRGYRGVEIVSDASDSISAFTSPIEPRPAPKPSCEPSETSATSRRNVATVPTLKRVSQGRDLEEIMAEGLCPWLKYRREELILRATEVGASRQAAEDSLAKLVANHTFHEVDKELVGINP
jgi:putative DNA primase/helicase